MSRTPVRNFGPVNKSSLYLRGCLFLLLLASIVTSDSIAQRFQPRIVFDSNRNGNWGIYTMDVVGNNLVQLTDNSASDASPACSPDGKKIAFTSKRDGNWEVYVMDSDGSNPVRLTKNGNPLDAEPCWSPDGTKLAFVSSRVGNFEIYTMDTDGTNPMRLTNHAMTDYAPSWSPDGSQIAFHSNRDTGIGSMDIFVMDSDGKRTRNLTHNMRLTKSFNPTWSPDGNQIAFDSWRDSSDIYVMTARGKGLVRLTEGKGNNVRPSYSPDGTRIAFVSDRDGDWNIYLMNADRRHTVRFTRTPPGTESSSPCWLPGASVVTPNGKLSTSWGEVKQTGNP